MLFLHFLWVSRPLKVVLDLIMTHLLLVTVRAENLMWLVIVVAMDNFTSAFNIIEAFADGGANLVS